jgi:hypothetical protein
MIVRPNWRQRRTLAEAAVEEMVFHPRIIARKIQARIAMMA